MALFSKILIFYVIGVNISFVIIWFISHEKTHIRLLSAFLVGITWPGNDSNLLIVFYVQIMPDDLVMQLHRF